jgi:CRISPR-associated protein Cas1
VEISSNAVVNGWRNQDDITEIANLHQPYLAATITEISPEFEEEKSPFQKNIWNEEMAAIYLLEQGTSIYKDYQRFIIHVAEKPAMEIPMREVEQIMVFGNIQLSTPVIQACLHSEIPVLFLSQTGLYHGHLWSESATNLDHQLVQVARLDDDDFQLQMCRAITYGKLTNSKQLL